MNVVLASMASMTAPRIAAIAQGTDLGNEPGWLPLAIAVFLVIAVVGANMISTRRDKD